MSLYNADLEPASVFNNLSSSQPKMSMILSTVHSLYTNNPCTVHTLYTDNLRIHTLYIDSPCMHQKIGFFYNSENFTIMILDLLKLQCVHEILPISSLLEYIFNHSQEIHTKNSLTRSSPSILQKIFSQEALH
jgi:hypothetical protein